MIDARHSDAYDPCDTWELDYPDRGELAEEGDRPTVVPAPRPGDPF